MFERSTAARAGTHRCLAGPDCRRAQTLDGERCGAPTDKPGTLCGPCLHHISSAVKQLPADWALLRHALGDRTISDSGKIRSTPTAAIPISARKDSLMSAIVDMADRAAAIVSQLLNTDQPHAYKGKGHPVHQAPMLARSISLVEPHITRLAAVAAETHNVWAKPRRCQQHSTLIDAAETGGHTDEIREAYAAAGDCGECNAWWKHGQQRDLTELSGIDIALELANLHDLARAELGETRRRQRYTMPCPDCGARVYRNDGQSIVICEGDAQHTRTEREYKVLTGLELGERLSMAHHKFWLAEAYWRLDRAQGLVDILEKEPGIEEDPRATMILEHLRDILAQGAPDDQGEPIPHQTPKQRATGTTKAAALERQVDEDNWTWRNEKPYEKPNKKRRKQTPSDAPKIHPASLSTLVDIDETAAPAGTIACTKCHLTLCDCA